MPGFVEHQIGLAYSKLFLFINFALCMCILFIAIQQHPEYPLIIAANRDEFHQRPTQAAHYWPETPELLAGKDLKAGGSWMGVNKQGRIAALTNIRDPQHFVADKQSRGSLVTEFLTRKVSPHNYLQQLQQSATQYNGFNLLFGDYQHLQVFNSATNSCQPLTKGTWGLSNAALNSPWPKVSAGMQQLETYCQQTVTPRSEDLFALLQNQQKAADETLPSTGVSLEWERQLSSIFIQGEEYGTRSSSILMLNANNQLQWHDRTYDQQAQITRQKSFTIRL